MSIWEGWAKGNKWIWERFFSFFWEDQSLRHFDVGNKTLYQINMISSLHTPAVVLFDLVLARAGLALASLFFFQPMDTSSFFPLGRIEQWMTLLGFQLLPTSTHTVKFKDDLIYKSCGRKKEDVVCFYHVIKIIKEKMKQSPASGPVAWEIITSYQKKGIPWKQL